MQGHSFHAAAGAGTFARHAAIAGALMLAATLSSAQDAPDAPERAEGPTPDVALPSNAEIMSNPVLRNALSRSSEGLVFQRAPDGSVSVDLQGRFQNVSVARIDADGEIRTGCVTSHESLAEFLAAHPGASEEDYEAETKGHGDDR